MKVLKFTFFLLVLFLCSFWNIRGYGLFEPDEARYAEIPREMMEEGDFLTPRLNYVKYFEKPPLHYWLTTSGMKLFGVNERGARIIPVLGGLGGVAATMFFGRAFLGSPEAILGGLILGTGFLWSVLSNLNTTDMTLTFFLSLGLFAYYLGIRRNRRWLYLFYASMALATLTKGLIGVVLPGGIILCWICWRQEWRLIPKSLFFPGIVLFFALVAPWFGAVWKQNPEFGWFFFVHEHFLRYTSTVHQRQEPWWYFLGILPLGLLPWTGVVLEGLFWSPYNERYLHQSREGLFSYLLFWTGFTLFFFSLSGSKLIPYILPVFPPLSLLGGIALHDLVTNKNMGRKKILFFAFWPLLFALALGTYTCSESLFYSWKIWPPLVGLGLLPACCALGFCCGKRTVLGSSILLFVIGFSFLGGVKSLAPFLESSLSGKPMAELIQKAGEPEDTVVTYQTYIHGLAFYLKRRIVLGEYEGELAFGKVQEPEKTKEWFLSGEGLAELWKTNRGHMLVVVPREALPSWQKIAKPEGIFLGERDGMLLFKNIFSKDLFPSGEGNLEQRMNADYIAIRHGN